MRVDFRLIVFFSIVSFVNTFVKKKKRICPVRGNGGFLNCWKNITFFKQCKVIRKIFITLINFYKYLKF